MHQDANDSAIQQLLDRIEEFERRFKEPFTMVTVHDHHYDGRLPETELQRLYHTFSGSQNTKQFMKYREDQEHRPKNPLPVYNNDPKEAKISRIIARLEYLRTDAHNLRFYEKPSTLLYFRGWGNITCKEKFISFNRYSSIEHCYRLMTRLMGSMTKAGVDPLDNSKMSFKKEYKMVKLFECLRLKIMHDMIEEYGDKPVSKLTAISEPDEDPDDKCMLDETRSNFLKVGQRAWSLSLSDYFRWMPQQFFPTPRMDLFDVNHLNSF